MALQRRLILLPLLILLALFACKAKPETEEQAAKSETEQQYQETEAEPESPAPSAEKRPLQKHEYTWSGSDDIPPVVIIIDDFGNSAGQLLEDFADLPKEIVFAVLPDLPHTETAAKLARKKGHEVIIHIPMQAEGSSVSPGAKYIKAGMPHSEIAEIIEDFIAQMPMAIAANNHMGSKATADLATMNSVISVLKNNGMYFIDSATTANSAVFTAAEELGVFSTRRDIFLDVPDVSDATLISKIESLGKYKGRNEPIVIITHCHNREKLDALKKFITQIEEMGVRIESLKKAYPRVRV